MTKLTTLLLSSILVFGVAPDCGIAQIVKTPTTADKRKAEIAAIKSYENEVLFDVYSHLPSLSQFVKDSPTASWHEVKSSAVGTRNFLSASVGFRNEKPVFISIDHRGKNQKTPDASILLFRPDGTLAKYILIVDVWLNNSLRTSKGKIQYFDAKGQVLLTALESKDWKTKNFSRLKSLSVPQLPAYMRIEQLPFYPLLKDKKAGATKTTPTSPIKPGIEMP